MSSLSVPHAMSFGGAICAFRCSKVSYSTIHQGFRDTIYLNGCSIRKRMMRSVADITPVYECSVKPRHAVQHGVTQFAGN